MLLKTVTMPTFTKRYDIDEMGKMGDNFYWIKLQSIIFFGELKIDCSVAKVKNIKLFLKHRQVMKFESKHLQKNIFKSNFLR